MRVIRNRLQLRAAVKHKAGILPIQGRLAAWVAGALPIESSRELYEAMLYSRAVKAMPNPSVAEAIFYFAPALTYLSRPRDPRSLLMTRLRAAGMMALQDYILVARSKSGAEGEAAAVLLHRSRSMSIMGLAEAGDVAASLGADDQ